MPLIFLDTPQIGMLEWVRRENPSRYRSFVDVWKGRGCTLAFTMTQLGELLRYEEASRREGRYLVIEDLAPIRTENPLDGSTPPLLHILISREIVCAILEQNLEKAVGSPREQLCRWVNVFPGRIEAGVAEWLRSHETEQYLGLLNLQYDASQFAAGAEGSRTGANATRRVRDLRQSPLTAEEYEKHLAEIDKVVASMPERSRREGLPMVPADTLLPIQKAAREFLSRMSEVGPRAALLERLPVTGLSEGALQKLPTHELVNSSVFETWLRLFVRETLQADEAGEEFLARTLRLSDCPGWWLQMQLRICVRRGSRRPRPNHQYDAERLAYLPYVDLLITDAEMAEFVRQIQNDNTTPNRVRGLRPPLSIPSTIDALEVAVQSSAGAP